jgi:dienelactone hydrolase
VAAIEVEPEISLADGPLRVRLTGFQPGQRVVLCASLTDDDGAAWESQAAFACDSSGAADPGEQAPVTGSYKGADPAGLLWSMSPAGKGGSGVYVKSTLEPQFIDFTAESGGATVASARAERRYLAEGVERIPLSDGGVTGTYFKPAGEGPHPAVMVMHGTVNRVMEDTGSLLAARGLAALSLLYFGGAGQPPEYIGIPVEYFERAIVWLQARPEVKPGGVALLGVSRGGEGALLAASLLEQVNAVVSISGGGVVFEGLHADPRNGDPQAPFTWQGRDVPFLERSDSPAFMARAIWCGIRHKPLSTLSTYSDAMRNRAAVERAAIAVEKIKGPVLMVSGRRDQVWPSSELSRMVVRRLEEHGHPYPYEHLDYEGSGHGAYLPYRPTLAGRARAFSGTGLKFGGEPRANAQAAIDAWPRVLGFLEDNLVRQRER